MLVGVHSDETLKDVFGSESLEDFETRSGRLLQNRHVCLGSSTIKGLATHA